LTASWATFKKDLIMPKRTMLVTFGAMCLAVASTMVLAKPWEGERPSPINGVHWVCHEFGEGFHHIPVKTAWKLKEHMRHGDTMSDENGKHCPPVNRRR
jgi:hypothetical protein